MDASGDLILGNAQPRRLARRAIGNALPESGGTPAWPTFSASPRRAAASAPSSISPRLSRSCRRRRAAAPFHAADRSAFSERPSLQLGAAAGRCAGADHGMAWAHLAWRCRSGDFRRRRADRYRYCSIRCIGAPGAPLEGDGTLTLSHWSAQSASESESESESESGSGSGSASLTPMNSTSASASADAATAGSICAVPPHHRPARRRSGARHGRRSRHRHTLGCGLAHRPQ